MEVLRTSWAEVSVEVGVTPWARLGCKFGILLSLGIRDLSRRLGSLSFGNLYLECRLRKGLETWCKGKPERGFGVPYR